MALWICSSGAFLAVRQIRVVYGRPKIKKDHLTRTIMNEEIYSDSGIRGKQPEAMSRSSQPGRVRE